MQIRNGVQDSSFAVNRNLSKSLEKHPISPGCWSSQGMGTKEFYLHAQVSIEVLCVNQASVCMILHEEANFNFVSLC